MKFDRAYRRKCDKKFKKLALEEVKYQYKYYCGCIRYWKLYERSFVGKPLVESEEDYISEELKYYVRNDFQILRQRYWDRDRWYIENLIINELKLREKMWSEEREYLNCSSYKTRRNDKRIAKRLRYK